jgi:hypothetical protein
MVHPEGAFDHRRDGELAAGARPRGGAEAARFRGILDEPAHGCGDRLGRVFDQNPCVAVEHGFGEAAGAACDNRHARRCREQRAGTEALGVADVDEQGGALQIPGRSREKQTSKPPSAAAAAMSAAPFAGSSLEGAMMRAPPRAGSAGGTPSKTTEILEPSTPPDTSCLRTKSETAMKCAPRRYFQRENRPR